jgi:hypothetical protein
MSWVYNLLVSLDQLANTLIGGNPDVTISGKVGLKSSKDSKWVWLEQLIDFTFEPIETNHCLRTYLDENDFDDSDNLIVTSIVAVIGCVVLIPIIRIISLFK